MKSIKKVQIVGDDLYVTNLERLKKGFLNISSNAILIKLNQIGTVSETLDVIKFAQNIGFKTIKGADQFYENYSEEFDNVIEEYIKEKIEIS